MIKYRIYWRRNKRNISDDLYFNSEVHEILCTIFQDENEPCCQIIWEISFQHSICLIYHGEGWTTSIQIISYTKILLFVYHCLFYTFSRVHYNVRNRDLDKRSLGNRIIFLFLLLWLYGDTKKRCKE